MRPLSWTLKRTVMKCPATVGSSAQTWAGVNTLPRALDQRPFPRSPVHTRGLPEKFRVPQIRGKAVGEGEALGRRSVR